MIGDDHDGEERNQRREQQAIDENNSAGFFQVLQLGVLNLPIYLCEGLLAAHGQHGVAEADKGDDPGQMTDPSSVEPAERFLVQKNDAWVKRIGWNIDRNPEERNHTPDDKNNHHDGGDRHDLKGFLAGFVNALNVFPPEVDRDQRRKAGRKRVVGKMMNGMAHVLRSEEHTSELQSHSFISY